MTDYVRVTAAPGCHFTIPHPSGIAELPRFVVNGGESVWVPAYRVEALWQSEVILHPVTGASPPRPAAMRYAGPAIGFEGGPMQPLDGRSINYPALATTAEVPEPKIKAASERNNLFNPEPGF